MTDEEIKAIISKAKQGTENAFAKHGVKDMCECTVNSIRTSQLATDGMRVALILSIQAFYNALAETLTAKAMRKCFDEFYTGLEKSIKSVGKSVDRNDCHQTLEEERDLLIYHSYEALRRMGIPKERYGKYL